MCFPGIRVIVFLCWRSSFLVAGVMVLRDSGVKDLKMFGDKCVCVQGI